MRAIAKFFDPKSFEYISKLEQYNEQLELGAEQLKVNEIELRGEIQELHKQVAQLTEENQRLSESNQKLEVAVTELVAEMESLYSQNDDLTDTITMLNNLDQEELRRRYDSVMENVNSPWSIFEVLGFDENGVKINFNWNHSFIQEINKMGFVGEDEEELVQQFFALMKMLPSGMLDSPVNNIS